MISEIANNIFKQAIDDYHQFDNIDQAVKSPFKEDSIEHLLYLKNWIDTAQWHMEDVVRNPNIDPIDVSYKHLDVYKRQVEHSTICIN